MKKIILIILTILIINNLTAQTTKDSLPGDTSLTSSKEELLKLASFENNNYIYSIEDFIQNPNQYSFRFSPNGLYLSYKERDANSKVHVFVKNTKTNEVIRVIKEEQDLISEYGWANNERLFYLKDNGGDENYHLFAVDINGKNQIELTPFEKVETVILSNLQDRKEYMIIKMNKDNPQIYEPYKINIKTGELYKLFEVKDPSKQIHSYNFDKEGKLKGYTQLQNGTEYVYYYRVSEDKPFEEVIKRSSKDKFRIIDFNYSTDNPHDVYVVSNMANNTDEIILYDLDKKELVRKVYSNETFDIKGLKQSGKRGYEVDYYYYYGEKHVIVPVSETYSKLHDKFVMQFRNKCFTVTDMTDEEDKYLLFVESDKMYGIYYLYDVEKDVFKELFNLKSNLKEKDMAAVRPIKFTSRDGLTLYGYLTLPKQVENGKKVPLIVHPHGGPHYVRDYWEFNTEHQLFASRGYAILQINYRGSYGYGKAFYQASFKQIGRKMLNDLEDGVAYVKTLNLIDENKIGIYGGSYGGLATLQSLVKTPDLYACGVDYVGPSNLFTFFESLPPYMKPRMNMLYEAWYNPNLENEQQIMKEVSPVLNVVKIKKPVFVIQGANDPRVNINESDQIVRNLRKRGFDIPYMVKYNEGHGFRNEENEIELYKTMMGFFAKHLKN
ncbi:MAG: prolyl oligopeptidase family serine peptidase [Bacteroidales bacterium]|nr:prolyl oligopeptidase family serine peptidase [Bacteroidales bacterium]